VRKKTTLLLGPFSNNWPKWLTYAARLRFRNPLLYPAELLPQSVDKLKFRLEIWLNHEK
jgi:hypothetical protein